MKKIIYLILSVLLFISGCSTGSVGLPAQADHSNNDPITINPPPGLTQPPPTVPKIKSAIISAGKVDVSWTDDSPYEDGFIVKRDGVEVGKTNRNIAIWTDSNVKSGTTYCYTVTAYNKEWITIPSPEQCATVPVHPNQSPVISGIAATPAGIEVGKQASITCTALDPDSDPLTYIWTSSRGAISGSGSNITWTAPAQAGSYLVQCAVSDGKGGQALKVLAIAVTTPPPPPKWTLPVGAEIRSIAIDQSTGEVYASGSTRVGLDGYANAGMIDVFLAKFNPDGTKSWLVQMGGKYIDWSRGHALAAFNGNVYLLWRMNIPSLEMGTPTAVIQKLSAYANGGKLSWTITLEHGDDLTVNAGGIYLTSSWPTLARVDFNGVVLWEVIPTVGIYAFTTNDIAVVNGDIYLGGTYANAAVMKYDINGSNWIWWRVWKQIDTADTEDIWGITGDDTGIYTAGYTGFNTTIGTGPRWLVFKYDFDGNLLWSRDDLGLQGFTTSIVSDASGIYVGGSSPGDTRIIKLNHDTGAVLWQNNQYASSIVLYGNTLFVADDTNHLKLYDTATGLPIP